MKISVHVTPGSRSTFIEWRENLFGEKTLFVKIREKPVDGEANLGLIDALSEHFRVSKSQIQILKGHTSRDKMIDILDR